MKSNIPKYYTDQSIKDKIDSLLQTNATNISALGTKSSQDLGEKQTKSDWKHIEREIKKIDPFFYDIIRKQDD